MMLVLLLLVAAEDERHEQEQGKAEESTKDAEHQLASERGKLIDNWPKWLRAHALVDVNYAYATNNPPDGRTFDNQGLVASQHNALSINLLAIGLSMKPEPVGFDLILHAGTSADELRKDEPVVWRYVQQVNISGRVPVGRGLLVQAGIMPSLMGLESFVTKNNWNYTLSWADSLLPNYDVSLRFSYELIEKLTVQVEVANGWGNITENNAAKSLASRVAYDTEHVSVAFATFSGPELDGDNRSWRLAGDANVIVRPHKRVSLAASVNGGREKGWHWIASAMYARVMPLDWLGMSARADVFYDPNFILLERRPFVWSGTATVDFHFTSFLLLFVEGRYDPQRFLCLLSGVAYF